MRCPNCQTENPDRSLTCKACGVRLEPITPPSDEERSRQLVEDAFRLSDEGKLAQAIAACRRAISANPNSTSAYSLLGILFERAGQREQAIQAYEAALRLSPESVADRESLRQLISPPQPAKEAAAPRVVEVPAAPPTAIPVPAKRQRWVRTVGWATVGALAIIVVAILFMTLRASRSGVPETSQFTRSPAPAAAPAVPAQPAPAPVTASIPLAPAPPPALPTRAAPATPAPAPAVEPSPAPSTTSPTPTVSITIPAPEAFIARAAASPAPPSAPPAAPANVKPTPAAARARFFEGDLAGAIRIYEAAIADKTQATPEAYQEMGWLYYEAGRKADAAAAYQQSLDRYRQQLASGQDPEAARHGIRTAEAALKVLELE